MVFYDEANAFAPRQNPTSLIPDYDPPEALLSVNKLSLKFVSIPQQFDFHNMTIGILNFQRSIRLHWIFNRPDEEKPFVTSDESQDEESKPKGPTIPKNKTFWYNTIRDIYSFWRVAKISFPEEDYSAFNKNVVLPPGSLRKVIDQINKVKLESFLFNFGHEYINEAQRIQRNTVFPKNLTDEQENAIKDLREHPVIIQRPSEKTRNYVFTTADSYYHQARKTILKQNMVPLSGFSLAKLAAKFNRLLLFWFENGELSFEWIEAIKAKYPYYYHYKAANIYCQYKDHKPDPRSQRAISSSCGTFFKPTMQMILFHILPQWYQLNYQIKDTKALMFVIEDLNKVPRFHEAAQNDKLLIFSMDVIGMYPSILHNLSLSMMAFIYDHFGELEYKHPSPQCVRELLFFILRNNVADFNGEAFIQNIGIGQGVDFAAQVCDFVMMIFDLLLHNDAWVHQICELDLLYSGRYRDDYLLVGIGDLDDAYLLREGMNHLLDFNTAHETPINLIFQSYNFNLGRHRDDVKNIQFTTDINTYCPLSVQILEVKLIYNMDLCQLVSKVSPKKTDPHAYLDTNSCHPGSTFTGTITGVALRVRAITDDCYLEDEMFKYKCYLIARGYDPLTTNTIFNMYASFTKAQALRRWNPMNHDLLQINKFNKYVQTQLLRRKENGAEKPNSFKQDLDTTPCARLIHKYHPLLVGLFKDTLKRNWSKFIAGDAILSTLFPLSYFKETWQRAGLNLKERLTPNRFRDSNHKLAVSRDMTHYNRVQISLINHNLFNCKQFIMQLRINDDKFITIDNKICDRKLLSEWRGFVPCSVLKEQGIVKNVTKKCKCYATNNYPTTKIWKCKNTNESFKVTQRLSCFSRNLIYIIYCDRCREFYVGKCGAGINNNRCLRDRNNEHTKNILNVYKALAERSFYDRNGCIAQQNSLVLKGTINTIMKQSYTREILHFTGLDGTRCHGFNGGDPLKFYRIFGLRQFNELTRTQCEAKLCEFEKYFQAQMCSIIQGLNGMTDFKKTDTFTSDFKNKVDQIMIDNETILLSNFEINIAKLQTFMIDNQLSLTNIFDTSIIDLQIKLDQINQIDDSKQQANDECKQSNDTDYNHLIYNHGRSHNIANESELNLCCPHSNVDMELFDPFDIDNLSQHSGYFDDSHLFINDQFKPCNIDADASDICELMDSSNVSQMVLPVNVTNQSIDTVAAFIAHNEHCQNLWLDMEARNEMPAERIPVYDQNRIDIVPEMSNSVCFHTIPSAQRTDFEPFKNDIMDIAVKNNIIFDTLNNINIDMDNILDSCEQSQTRFYRQINDNFFKSDAINHEAEPLCDSSQYDVAQPDPHRDPLDAKPGQRPILSNPTNPKHAVRKRTVAYIPSSNQFVGDIINGLHDDHKYSDNIRIGNQFVNNNTNHLRDQLIASVLAPTQSQPDPVIVDLRTIQPPRFRINNQLLSQHGNYTQHRSNSESFDNGTSPMILDPFRLTYLRSHNIASALTTIPASQQLDFNLFRDAILDSGTASILPQVSDVKTAKEIAFESFKDQWLLHNDPATAKRFFEAMYDSGSDNHILDEKENELDS